MIQHPPGAASRLVARTAARTFARTFAGTFASKWAGPLAGLVCLLSACGGDGVTPTPAPTPALTAAPAPASTASVARRAATAALPADNDAVPYDPTLLFDWAEHRYPDWFPGPEADRVLTPFLYRAYPATGNHLGVAGTAVAVLGPATNGQLLPIGALADWTCAVLPQRCSTAPTLADRRAAAATAATQPECLAAAPLHWSIGDAGGRLAEGQVGSGAPDAGTVMPIASASKWLFAAYVAERRQGVLTSEDIALLNFTSGYTGFDLCLQRQTVAECQAYQGLLIHNGGFDATQVGRFHYSGGHMQRHAVLLGLGSDDNTALAQHIGSVLGLTLAYTQPQLAGGVATSADVYGSFLRRVLARRLHMGDLLGAHAVCTNPATCPSAVYSPIAGSLSWHYAIGHWVEDDPAGGDGAFSSAGAFGFYPWIDRTRSWWGIVARHDTTGLTGDDPDQRPARDSAACGARIRAAWITGLAG
jgi:hypothetical protein